MSLLNNEMIVCGGKPTRAESRCLSSVEIYNPETDQWTSVAPMRMDCAHMTATGKVEWSAYIIDANLLK